VPHVSINTDDEQSWRRVRAYRAGIWLYRIAIVCTLAPLPFRLAGIRIAPAHVAGLLALANGALILGGHWLVRRVATSGKGPDRPQIKAMLGDLLWLNRQ
jgi:hypothetical protein